MTHHHHEGSQDGADDVAAMFTAAHWDERYSSSERLWSGRPNQRLVEQVTHLAPGRSLDVGCGEGADVIWLAQQGWHATGADVSTVALERAAVHARQEGVAETTAWLPLDLFAGEPVPGGFDLVTAFFLHLPGETFEPGYRSLADAVAPGGTLLVVAHHPDDDLRPFRNPQLAPLMFGPERITPLLEPAAWEIEVADAQPRTGPHPEDRDLPEDQRRTLVHRDTVVRARRR